MPKTDVAIPDHRECFSILSYSSEKTSRERFSSSYSLLDSEEIVECIDKLKTRVLHVFSC